jgi:hypothetical protein
VGQLWLKGQICWFCLPPDRLAEAQCVAHLVCARNRASEVESLPFKQAAGSGVLHTGNRGQPADPGHRRQALDEGGHGGSAHTLASRGRGEAVADLNTAFTVGRAVGPQIAEDPFISAADD